jgi:uncharacterized protein YqeY
VAALVERMRQDLARAMKARDRQTAAVLRTTLAAIANAEAPPAEPGETLLPPVYGRGAEVPRLELSDADIERILRDEIADRRDTIGRFEQGGRADEAVPLHAELAILESYVA